MEQLRRLVGAPACRTRPKTTARRRYDRTPAAHAPPRHCRAASRGPAARRVAPCSQACLSCCCRTSGRSVLRLHRSICCCYRTQTSHQYHHCCHYRQCRGRWWGRLRRLVGAPACRTQRLTSASVHLLLLPNPNQPPMPPPPPPPLPPLPPPLPPPPRLLAGAAPSASWRTSLPNSSRESSPSPLRSNSRSTRTASSLSCRKPRSCSAARSSL
eukprot:scaffold42004_cov61-Phaeocystis_antarctica.AAC.1